MGNVNDVDGLVGILVYVISSLPLKYLGGLLLGASFKVKSIRDGVIEKIGQSLAGWKRIHLSKGGRIILIKSTLSILPTYFMSLFSFPALVANHIEKCYSGISYGWAR